VTGRSGGSGPFRVVHADNPSPMTLDGTRTFVVGRRRPVVIDPGPDDPLHVERILDALAGSSPIAILLTHHHPDHSAAAPRLAAATGAEVRMAAGALDVGFPRVDVGAPLPEGAELHTDVGPVRAVGTPGHSPEHMAFFWTGADAPGGGALFVGDLLMGAGDTTLVAAPEGDLATYLRSLERVRALGAGVLLPAHGPPLADPPAAVARYVRHREERIAQVLSALEGRDPLHPRHLVDLVYGSTLDPRLRAAAEASILAMLDYLSGLGRVASDADGRYRSAAAIAATESLFPQRSGRAHE
jgi:glyoxylase-like metal-dependent hydrolase (beta-lactamase superfamily II)